MEPLKHRTRNTQHATRNLFAILITFTMVLGLTTLLAPALAHAFTASTVGDYGNVTVMEVDGNFDAELGDGSLNVEPRQEIAKEFYRLHEDDYDFLVIFSNFDYAMPTEDTKAFYSHIKNDVQGIGLDIMDNSSLYGSEGKLQGTVDMGNVADLGTITIDPSFNETLDTLSHEILHRWAAHVKFRNPDGSVSDALLGKDGSHWSYLLDTDGSTIYGHDWQDNGDGTFTATAVRKFYSPLDRYLMGMIDKSAVPPMLLIENPSIDPAQLPEEGVTITGTARYVTIDDIIAVEGERVPDSVHAQKEFKTAFIFVTQPGTFTGDELYSLESVRNGWLTRYSVLTDGESIVKVVSTLRDDLPENPGWPELPHDPRTLPADIEDGVAWLMNNQQIDGSWTDISQTRERDTAESVLALNYFDTAAANYSLGIQWLNGYSSENMDYLARKASALSGAGDDVALLIDEIVSRRNSDGGWGSNRNYMSNPVDTSLALNALTAAGVVDQAVTGKAIEYLTAVRNADNGWGSVQATAAVLDVLNEYRNSYPLDDAINGGVDWLLARQNSDGGFGNSPSTIYDTATALLTIQELDVPGSVRSGALNYIQSRQSQNGSWYSSPYQTALAIQAVWKASVDPDLSIKNEDITLIPADIVNVPANVAVSVDIQNLGRTGANAAVTLYEGFIDEANRIDKQSGIVFPGMKATTVTFQIEITDGSERTFIVVVDEDNAVNEQNETNNWATFVIQPEPGVEPDLTIKSADIKFIPETINDIPADIEITADVTNLGLSPVTDVVVVLYENEVAPEKQLDQVTVSVEGRSGSTVSFNVMTNDGLEHTYYIVVDPDNTVQESVETNNEATKTIKPIADYDFAISADGVTLSSDSVETGNDVTITAQVTNRGKLNAYNVQIRYFIDDNGMPFEIANLLIDEIPAGQTVTHSYTWITDKAGVHMPITVQIDPHDLIREITENNNSGFAFLTVTEKVLTEPNLTTSYKDIIITPDVINYLGSVSISAVVKNEGFSEAVNISVNIYNGVPELGGNILATHTISSLQPGESAVVTAEWADIAEYGERIIYVAVDPGNLISETDETDNDAFKTLTILSLPDLMLTHDSIVFTPSVPKNGDMVEINVQVQNIGDQIAYNVPISVYENGSEIDNQVIEEISGSSQLIVAFDYETAGKSGAHEISVIVDPDNIIEEMIETNNSASGKLGVQDSNLFVSEPYFSPNGDGIKDSTRYSFRLESVQTVRVLVINEYDETVRTFDGGELNDVLNGSVTWDGLNDRGSLVEDGQYRMKVVDENSNELSTALVTVDNNLSPLADAIGTKYQRDIPIFTKKWNCDRNLQSFDWFPDDSGIVVSSYQYKSTGEVCYPVGLYVHSADGKSQRRIVPEEWTNGADPRISYSFGDVVISPSSDRIAFGMSTSAEQPELSSTELWLVDRDGRNLTLVDSSVDNLPGYPTIHNAQWSPDGKYLAYRVGSEGDVELWIVNSDGTDRKKVDVLSSGDYSGGLMSFIWSPDSTKIAINLNLWQRNTWQMDKIDVFNVVDGNLMNIADEEGLRALQWLNSEKIILSKPSSTPPLLGSSYIIYDIGKNQLIKEFEKHVELDWTVRGEDGTYDYVNVSPDGQTFAYLEIDYSNGYEGKVSLLKLSDLNGNTRVLFDFSYFDSLKSPLGMDCASDSEIAINMQWSNDGRYITFPLFGEYCFGYEDYGVPKGAKFAIVDVIKNQWKFYDLPTEAMSYDDLYIADWQRDDSIIGCNGYDHCDEIYLLNPKSEAHQVIPYKGGFNSNSGWIWSHSYGLMSPSGNYINYGFGEVFVKKGRGIISSLLNLPAELYAARTQSEIILSGTAVDLNFEGYKLEYSDAGKSDTWYLIRPASEMPVFDGEFAKWIPPHEGVFNVRLTVWDKAGNVKQVVRKTSWGKDSVISDIFLAPDIISPNADGIKDKVELHYSVHEPVNLEFNIYDENDALVNTITKNHLEAADDYVLWDGRDADGFVVPDGRYKIKVLTHELHVIVDTLPPDIYLEMSAVDQYIAPWESGAPHEMYLYSNIEGFADDLRIKEWIIEYGEGDNPDAWYEYRRGSDSLREVDSYGNAVSPIQPVLIDQYRDYDIEWLVGKKLRMRSEDFAGNKSSFISDFLPEQVILYKLGDGTISIKSNTASFDTGDHVLGLRETIRNDIDTLTVQLQPDTEGGQWSNVYLQPVEDGQSGFIELDWDGSGFDPAYDNFMRIRGDDNLGNDYYSNEIKMLVNPVFTIEMVCGETKKVEATADLDEALVLLKFEIRSDHDPAYKEWTDFKIYDTSLGDTIPDGILPFQVDLPPTRNDLNYEIRMTGTGGSGLTYMSNHIRSNCQQLIVEARPSTSEAISCNTLADKVNVAASVRNKKWFIANAAEGHFRIFKQKVEPTRGPEELMYEYSGPEVQKEWAFAKDFDTRHMDEGLYLIKARLNYYDKVNSGYTYVENSDMLIIDRNLPTARIDHPVSPEKACITKMSNDDVASYNAWYAVWLEGVIDVKNSFNSIKEWHLEQNCLACLGWIPATTRVDYPNGIIKGEDSVNGLFAKWDVTSSNFDRSLFLMAEDEAGNTTCFSADINLATLVEFLGISINHRIISPNGDGILDDTEISYDTSEYSEVVARIYPLNADKSRNGNEPVRIIEKSLSVGEGHIVWDGRDDSGNYVAEGLYEIIVVADDNCQNTEKRQYTVAVDNTPPDVEISSPLQGDTVGSIVEVKGTANDPYLEFYRLEDGQGSDPESWNLFGSHALPVVNDVLAAWNTLEKDGVHTIKLTAVDQAGNRSSTSISVDIKNGPDATVIKDLIAEPEVISPNGDGKVDSAQIEYTLAGASTVRLDIIDSSGIVRRTYSDNLNSGGANTYAWDGTDNAGAKVADGDYTVRVTATLTSNVSISQTESVRVTVDTAPPFITLTEPLDNAFLSSDVKIVGSVSDLHLKGYDVKYSNQSTEYYVDSGNRQQDNYTFGILRDLASGMYTITANATDLGENMSEIMLTVITDNTAPVVVLNAPKEEEFYGYGKNAVNIEGSIVEDNLDAYSIRYGEGADPVTWTDLTSNADLPVEPFTWDVNDVQDGSYTLSLRAVDRAGFTGEARVLINVDNTPPEVAITSPLDGDYVTGSVDIEGRVSDLNLTAYEVLVSSGKCSSAIQWMTLGNGSRSIMNGLIMRWTSLSHDGDYCLKVSAVDKLDNTAEVMINVSVDAHPPASPVLSGEIRDKTDGHLWWTENADPELAGYNVYRNGIRVNEVLLQDISYADPDLQHGTYIYIVKAVDRAGNESEPSNEIELGVDLVGPDVNLISPASGAIVGGSIDIKGTAYSAGDFKEYRIYLGLSENPGSWTLIRKSPVPVIAGPLATWDTSGLDEGSVYAVKLEAEDINGNKNDDEIIITIDNLAPAPPILVSADQIDMSVPDATIVWDRNQESDIEGYLLYRDDKLANASSFTVTDLMSYVIDGTTYFDRALADGTYIYYLLAIDKAGNVSLPSEKKFLTIDMRPPHAVIVEPENWHDFEKTIVVKAESPDTDIASVQFMYRKRFAADWYPIGNPVTSYPYMTIFDPAGLGLGYGEYEIMAVATDLSEQSDPDPEFITVGYWDMTPPDKPMDLASRVIGDSVTLTWTESSAADLDSYIIYRRSEERQWWDYIGDTQDTTYTESGLDNDVYTYYVTAVDKEYNESEPSNEVLAKVYSPVIEQPYTPLAHNSVDIRGTDVNPEDQIDLYIDTGNMVPLARVAADGSGEFSVKSIPLVSGENRITAIASDIEGNISKMSDEVVVVYNEPPAAPTNFISSIAGHNITFEWDLNTETDLEGYNLYRNNRKINLPTELNGADVDWISASSYYSYYTYSPSNAIDSDPLTYWMPYNGSSTFKPVWWEMDLASPMLLSEIEIQWESSLYSGRDYEVQVWTGYAWVTQVQVSGNNDVVNIYKFYPSYRTDKIRILVTDTNDPNQIKFVKLAEVKVLKDQLVNEAAYSDMDLADKKYDYAVTAVDHLGFESLPAELTVEIGDVVPPNAPVDLAAHVIESDVVLNWTDNAEPDIAGYNVYKQSGETWAKLNEVLVTMPTFTDPGLLNGTYVYRVTAVDAVNNESDPSNEASAIVDIAAPREPINLRVSSLAEGNALEAIWQYNGDPPGSYNIYRSLSSGGPYEKLNDTFLTSMSYIDTGLANDITYYYVVSAIDMMGNESAYSNEAYGAPVDSIMPSMPEIFFPTVPDIPIAVHDGNVRIAGTAEPGSDVSILMNGVYMGTTHAVEQTEVNEVQTFMSSYDGFDLSGNGKRLAYIDYGTYTVHVLDLENNNDLDTSLMGDSPKWSPNGGRILIDNYGNLTIYNMETGDAAPFSDDYFSYSDGVWSHDSRQIAVQSYRSGQQEIWVKDLEADSFSQATFNGYAAYPQWSYDSRYIAYLDSNNSLYYIDLETGVSAELVDNLSYNDVYRWSPVSNKIVYSKDYDIWLVDVETMENTRLTDGSHNESKPVWSPNGEEVLFVREDPFAYEYRLFKKSIADLEEVDLLPDGMFMEPQNIHWSRSGRILYEEFDTPYWIDMSGQFYFDDMTLENGLNIIKAVATDGSGDDSIPSESISVTLEGSGLPDLGVSGNAIGIYPLYPIKGDDISFNVAVGNLSSVDVEDVNVDVYIWDSEGNVNLIKSDHISLIGAESESYIGIEWNSSGKIGENSLIVIVDPEDNINEQSEENNVAIKDFYVAEQEGVSMSTSIDRVEYGSNQDMNIQVDILNTGPGRDVVVDVFVEDTDGYEVALLDSRSMSLSYGAEETYPLVWNTGATFAGTYKVHAILRNPPTVLQENVVPFDILPDLDIVSTLTTDRATYGPHDNVRLISHIMSNGMNYIIPELQVKMTVTDPDGNELFADEKTISNTMPGSGMELGTLWNAGLHEPGNYTAALEVLHEGQPISVNTSVFAIEEHMVLSGDIAVSPHLVILDGDVQTGFAVSNSGNSDANDLVIEVLIVDPEDSTVIDSYTESVSIGMNGTWNGSHTFSTRGYALTTYAAMLRYTRESQTVLVDTEMFMVKDGKPPVVSVLSPLEGDIIGIVKTLSVRATDDASGVDKVVYSIDGGTWIAMAPADPVSGRYAATWVPGSDSEGPHSFSFRATDKAGNISTTISVNATVDLSPPSTVLTIGSPKYQTQDNDYVRGITIFTLNATDNLSAVAGTEYRIDSGQWTEYSPFNIASEGVHVIGYRSTDNAGNRENIQSATVTVDETSPVTLMNVEEPHFDMNGNIYINAGTVISAAASDAGCGVAVTECSVDGAPFSPYAGPIDLTPYTDGQLSITCRSVDNLGNVEVDNTIIVLLDTVAPVTSMSIGTPQYVNDDNVLYVTRDTVFSLSAGDDLSGVSSTEYRFDSGAWTDYAPFSIADEGAHAIEYRSQDNIGNIEDVHTEDVVVDNSPPVLAIVSPTSGTRFTGPFDVTATAVDGLSGVERVEYRIDGSEWQSLTLNNVPSGTWSAVRTPLLSDEGNHIVGFRTFDNLGNASEIVTTDVTIEVLFGTITADPDPVYQGRDETLTYTVTNSSGEDISALNITIRIIDPDTGDTRDSFTITQAVAGGETVTGTQSVSTANLEPKTYTVELAAFADTMTALKTLASTTFEVRPGVEITKTIPDVTNLLVWVNDGCGRSDQLSAVSGQESAISSQRSAISYQVRERSGEHENDHNGEGHQDGDNDDEHNSLKKCIRIDLLESILAQTGDSYFLVFDKRDFQEEMRSPYYTDIVILGDHYPLEDHYKDELTEQVHAGRGLVSSLYFEHGKAEEGCKKGNEHEGNGCTDGLFGIRFNGQLSGDGYPVELLDSPVSAAGLITSKGTALRTEALDPSSVAAWILDRYEGNDDHHGNDNGQGNKSSGYNNGHQNDNDNDDNHDDNNQYPGIVLNGYGKGETVFFAFDPGMTLDDANYGTIAELLTRSIAHVHKPRIDGTARPNSLVPVMISVRSLGGELDVRLNESYPEGVSLYDLAAGQWIIDNPWSVDIHLMPDETRNVLYYVLMPDNAGTYAFNTEAGYLDNGVFISIEQLSVEIVIEKDISASTEEVMTEIDSLSLSGQEKAKARNASLRVGNTLTRSAGTAEGVDDNIQDLLSAVQSINEICTVDISGIRLGIDHLIIGWEGKWYFSK